MRRECCTRVARDRFCNKIGGTVLQNIHRFELFATCCRYWGYLATSATAFDFCRRTALRMTIKNHTCSHGFRQELRTFQPSTFQGMFLDTWKLMGKNILLNCPTMAFWDNILFRWKKSYSTANALRVYKLFNHTCSFRDAYQLKLLSSMSYEAYWYL